MKRFIVSMIATLATIILTGCNKTIIDTTYTFNYAIIQLPDGKVVEGKVET